MNIIPRRPFRQGFTLVEIMIVVVVIGLLTTMLIPAFDRVRQNSQNSRLMNDYRTFAAAFEYYALLNGEYPPDGAFAALPAPMQGFLPTGSWTNPPLGGQWIWDYMDRGITAGVSYRLPDITDEQMQRLDERFDDGDLGAGLFQKLDGDRFTYILEP